MALHGGKRFHDRVIGKVTLRQAQAPRWAPEHRADGQGRGIGHAGLAHLARKIDLAAKARGDAACVQASANSAELHDLERGSRGSPRLHQTPNVADGMQSVILPQVTFGIAVRMAVMGIVAGNEA